MRVENVCEARIGDSEYSFVEIAVQIIYNLADSFWVMDVRLESYDTEDIVIDDLIVTEMHAPIKGFTFCYPLLERRAALGFEKVKEFAASIYNRNFW